MSDNLRAWLSEELDRRGWSHRELARKTGLSQSIVSKTLSGERNTSADFCIKVAQVLEVAPEYLLRIADILPTEAAAPDDTTTQELIELIRNLSPETKQQALDYLRFLFQKDHGRGN